MATTIKLKRGTGTPASLEHAEPAVDLEKGCLHIGNNGTVQTYQLGCQNYAMPISKYLITPGWFIRGTSPYTTYGLSSMYLFFWPVVFPRHVAPNKALIEVTTAGAAGTSVRVGVYKNGWDSDKGDIPTVKLSETGLFDVDTVGLKEQPWSFVFKAGVMYWFAIYSNAPSVLIRALASSSVPVFGRSIVYNNTVCVRRVNYSNTNCDIPGTAPLLSDLVTAGESSQCPIVHFAEMPTYI